MTSIQINGLTKRFGSKTAVDSLELTIYQGELFALLGVNGAGKTTAIRMLTCLTKPTAGDAILMGDSIIRSPQAVKAKINISPQETAIAPKLSTRENLELIAAIYGAGREEARRKSSDMITAFSLGEAAHERAGKLSGGMQRRLSIAMALISGPQVLFLDEPTLGLDVLARRELWSSIRKLKRRITIILTTHYMEEAEALADRVGLMSKGKLKAVGTAVELIEKTGAGNFEDAFIALVTETEGET